MAIKIKNNNKKKDSFVFFGRGWQIFDMKLIIGTAPFFYE